MDTYNPGLHILSRFRASENVLRDVAACRLFFEKAIALLHLTKVGEAYHQFPGGGFTAVICLTESHISIHTWPELGLATFDVFLSNYQKDNSTKAEQLHAQTLSHFNGEEEDVHHIYR